MTIILYKIQGVMLACCAVGFSSPLFSQSTPTTSSESESDAVAVLSPIEVNSVSDAGHDATGTLAESRPRKVLVDTLALIPVMPTEFIDDSCLSSWNYFPERGRDPTRCKPVAQ